MGNVRLLYSLDSTRGFRAFSDTNGSPDDSFQRARYVPCERSDIVLSFHGDCECSGFIVTLLVGVAVQYWSVKLLVIFGLAVGIFSVFPSTTARVSDSFWVVSPPNSLSACSQRLTYNVVLLR